MLSFFQIPSKKISELFSFKISVGKLTSQIGGMFCIFITAKKKKMTDKDQI